MGAPLLLSFDLTNLDPFQKSLYGNADIIAVNQDQDEHGRGTPGGRRVSGDNFAEIDDRSHKMADTSDSRDQQEITCDSSTFPLNRTGVECEGLTANHSGDASAEDCQKACCANPKCMTWQYNPSYHPSGYPQEPCWNGVEKSVKPNANGWVGASKRQTNSFFNIWARNLFDGDTAMIFINNSPATTPPLRIRCDPACVTAAKLSPGHYNVLDLYTQKPVVGGVIIGKEGFDVGYVSPDAGSILWRLHKVTV